MEENKKDNKVIMLNKSITWINTLFWTLRIIIITLTFLSVASIIAMMKVLLPLDFSLEHSAVSYVTNLIKEYIYLFAGLATTITLFYGLKRYNIQNENLLISRNKYIIEISKQIHHFYLDTIEFDKFELYNTVYSKLEILNIITDCVEKVYSNDFIEEDLNNLVYVLTYNLEDDLIRKLNIQEEYYLQIRNDKKLHKATSDLYDTYLKINHRIYNTVVRVDYKYIYKKEKIINAVQKHTAEMIFEILETNKFKFFKRYRFNVLMIQKHKNIMDSIIE